MVAKGVINFWLVISKKYRCLKGDLWYGYEIDGKNKPNKLFLE